jgi:SET domain-containing protein
MFRIDDDYVVDATMKGNAARFLNHSCNGNTRKLLLLLLLLWLLLILMI